MSVCINVFVFKRIRYISLISNIEKQTIMFQEHVNFIRMLPWFLSLTIVAKALMLLLIQLSLFRIDLLRIHQCLVLYTSTLGQVLKQICKF